MDVLSDVLRTVRLTGSIFFTADLNDPWSITSPGSDIIIKHLPYKAECLTLFHIITEGSCWFQPEKMKPFSLQKGSVIIFPHSCKHIMCSNRSIHPVPLLNLLSFEHIKGLSDVQYGGDGMKTQFICGYLLCDQRFNPMLGAIPEVIVLSYQDIPVENSWEKPLNIIPFQKNSWLDTMLKQLINEVKGKSIGAGTIVTRLTELMYIEVLRRYMQGLPERSKGWLAALRDHEVGRALRLMHGQPANKWNVEQLAAEVGVSRSAFARRFTDLTGESPMRYLTGWRMQLAKKMLQQPDLSLSMVAEKIGYDSNIAFSKAFKRFNGIPPGNWREQKMAQV